MRVTKLKKLRKEKKLTMRMLAKKAKVSASTIWNLENGFSKQVDFKLKERVAQVLGVNSLELFPEIENETVNIPGFHELITLKRFVYDFKSTRKEDEFFRRVLTRMNDEEFGELFQSGRTMQETIKIMKKTAKKYDIEIPEKLKE